MDLYQKTCRTRDEKADSALFDPFYESLARPIMERFDALLSEPPRFQGSDEAFFVYCHFIRHCVGSPTSGVVEFAQRRDRPSHFDHAV